jgi:uncharacterized membrane protein (UPF0127 family)
MTFIAGFRFSPLSPGAVLGLALCAVACSSSFQPLPHTALSIVGHVLDVEVASTPAERTHGLMDRTVLPEGKGMLFVFQNDAPRKFWMKDTRIGLDILFFDERHQLVSMVTAPPCVADPCPIYISHQPARYALEIPAGEAARYQIGPNTRFEVHS